MADVSDIARFLGLQGRFPAVSDGDIIDVMQGRQ